MKKFTNIFFLLMILHICGFFANAQNQESSKSKDKPNSWISSKYDKSKNLTTVRIKQFTITKIGQEKVIANNIPLHQMDLEIFFTYPGQEIIKPQDITLKFHTVANNYIFLRGQPVIAVLNKEIQGQDRALGLGTTDYKSSPPKFNSLYEEFMTLKIPSDAFAKMAQANTLEVYVGPVGYQFNEEQKNVVKALALMFPSVSAVAVSPFAH